MTDEISLLTCGICGKKSLPRHSLSACIENFQTMISLVKNEINQSKKVAQACGMMKGYYIPPESADIIDAVLS